MNCSQNEIEGLHKRIGFRECDCEPIFS
jgi:hypothetical protein